MPIINLFNGQITQKLKEQLYSFLPTTRVLKGWVHLWSFIKLSCIVQKLLHFSLTDSQVGDLVHSGQKVFKNLHLHTAIQHSSIGLRISSWKSPYLVTENHHNFWTVQASLMKFHRWAYLINLCLIDKNENSCISSFLGICPWSIKLMGR